MIHGSAAAHGSTDCHLRSAAYARQGAGMSELVTLTQEQRAKAIAVGRKMLSDLSDDEVLSMMWRRILERALAPQKSNGHSGPSIFGRGLDGRILDYLRGQPGTAHAIAVALSEADRGALRDAIRSLLERGIVTATRPTAHRAFVYSLPSADASLEDRLARHIQEHPGATRGELSRIMQAAYADTARHCARSVQCAASSW